MNKGKQVNQKRISPNRVNHKHILISVYGILIMEAVFRISQSRSNHVSLYYEILIATLILLIHIIMSHIRAHKKSVSTQLELDILSERIPCGVAKIILDDNLTLLYGNPAYYSIHGYSPEELSEIMENKTALLLHPADVAPTLSELKKQDQYGKTINTDYRIVHKTGQKRWIHLEAFFTQMEDDYPLYQCIFTDVTEFQASIQQVEMEMERYRIISEISDDILFEYDIKVKTLTASQTFVNQYGMNPEILNFRQTVLDKNYIHHLDTDIFNQLCDNMDEGAEKISAELRFRLSHDRFVWYYIKGTVLTDKRGESIKIIGKAVNIDEQKRETETLTKKSQLDPLTGIYNKIVTGQLIDEYIANEGRHCTNALFIIDIDNFKGINDNLGHLFGDEVLTSISHKVKEIIRTGDIIGRIGGDEFVVFLKNIQTKEAVIHKAEEICGIFRNAYTGEKQDYKISGSIGIALYPQHGNDYGELFKKTDQALYFAKNGGKDRFEFYTEGDISYHSVNRSGVLSDSRRPFDELLLDNIYLLLDKNVLNAEVINQILRLVGENYQVNRAYIVEFSERDGQIRTIFSWCEEGYELDNSRFYNRTPKNWSNHLKSFDENGTFSYDSSLLTEEENYYKCATGSSLECAVVGDKHLRGITLLEDCHQNRTWTKYQKNTLIFIGKIMEYYLMHLQTQQKLIEAVSIDALTGTHSFEAFHTKAKELIRRNDDKSYALIISDIQRFKDINDLVGHNKGDKVITHFGLSIQENLGCDELIGRVSADIFTILVEYNDSNELAARMVEWNTCFCTSIQSLNIPNEICIASGIYLLQVGEDDIASLFDKANAARKIAKDTRQTASCYYDDVLHQKLTREKELEEYMFSSLVKGDFLIYLQPKYKLSNQEIVGAEALVRWNHPTLGFVLPSDFIPLFEKNLFVLNLDFYVFDKICDFIHKRIVRGEPVVPISVNFSRIHMTTLSFISELKTIIETHQVSPELLEIELTESAFINSSTDILKVIEELKNQGFKISMDDFGSGYSSLNALKDLPVDVLKLDKDFFKKDIVSDKEKIIIEGFVKMGKKLNLCIVSEGVESNEQADFLKEIECDLAQGYLFSRPVPIHEFVNML